MFTKPTRRTLTAATAALTLAAGLAVGTASSASADPAPAPALSGTWTTTTFTAPEQLLTPGKPIEIQLLTYGYRSWQDQSGWVSCAGGTWARLTPWVYPDSIHEQAYTTLPASDSGKFCTLTMTHPATGLSVFFPSNGITVEYLNGAPKLTINATAIARSANGGL